jgi:hypothetical protein
MSNRRPKTYAEFMALPMAGYCVCNEWGIYDLIGAESVAFSSKPNDLTTVYDRDGEDDRCWRLGRRADGTWFRQEIL